MKKTKPNTSADGAPSGPNMTKSHAAEIRRINKRIGTLDRIERRLESQRERTIQRIEKECEKTVALLRRKMTKDIRQVKKSADAEIAAIANEEAALLRRRCILEGRLAS